MRWIFPLSLLVLFEVIADVLAKEWSVHGAWIRGTGALVAYLIANTFWLVALKNGSELGRGAIIFSVASAILAVAVGVVLYHERVTSVQIVGFFLGVLSILLLFWE